MSAISCHTASLATYVRNTLSTLRHENGDRVCTLYGRPKSKRNTGSGAGEDKPISDAPNGSIDSVKAVDGEEHSDSPSNLVFGYLNLFSDGVHNFTDGIALGSAFLLYGSVGG